MAYDIYFSDMEENQIIQVPFPPANMPELAKTFDNQEFKVWGDGLNVNVLGNPSLVTFSLSGILPEYAGKYNYARSQINPYTLINLWSAEATSHKPLRCVMSRPDRSNILSWLVTVEGMNWYEEKNKDINYKVDFKQYSTESTMKNLAMQQKVQTEKEQIKETLDMLNDYFHFLR